MCERKQYNIASTFSEFRPYWYSFLLQRLRPKYQDQLKNIWSQDRGWGSSVQFCRAQNLPSTCFGTTTTAWLTTMSIEGSTWRPSWQPKLARSRSQVLRPAIRGTIPAYRATLNPPARMCIYSTVSIIFILCVLATLLGFCLFYANWDFPNESKAYLE